MKVSIEISAEYNPPHAVIYADEISPDIQRAMDVLGNDDAPITVQHGERMIIMQPAEIYMVRVENGQTMVYGKKDRFFSPKRLYEIRNRLGSGFIQISKSTLVNLSCMSSVEASFNGTLLLYLKNGLQDHVSRKYLSEFKSYLGL